MVLAIVAMPIGIVLDAIFPLEKYHPHYSDSIMLSIVGEGDEQHIAEQSGDGNGLVFYASRIVHDDESPMFPTNRFTQRYLNVSIFSPVEGHYSAEKADLWRPMLSEYFKKNGYDEKYVQDVLKPDIYQESTLWIGIWANGLVIGLILYAAGRVCISVAVAHKTRLKYKYGHCQTCGYDLTHADHKACPECGTKNPS
ncbi:MAG: hypothetical protein IH984_05370 [Planctomycetes bacterium]|nr:hypothetical protein [Planctomycetota bacterium]